MQTELVERKKTSYKIFDEIASTYDLLNRILSFGIDIFWRKILVSSLPKKNNLKVLDLATGTGDLALELSRSKKVKTVLGMDMSQGMIKFANIKAQKSKFKSKLLFQTGNGENIPSQDNMFDCATISFGIRNFSNPQKGLDEMYRVLSTQGKILILEFSLPKNIFVKQFYLVYFRHILPFVGKLLSKHSDAYTYLNETVEDFPYGNDFLNLMRKSGFINLKAKTLTFGIATLYTGEKN